LRWWPGGDTSGIPFILCVEWTEAQVKAFRLLVNRSVGWAEWDDELLAQEPADLKGLDFDLSLTGFDDREIDDFLSDPGDDDRANLAPPLPEHPASQPGDVWVMGQHRLTCGDCTQADVVSKLLGSVKREFSASVRSSGPAKKYGSACAEGGPVAPRHPFPRTCSDLRGMPH
jgi:hypothetical protein